LVYVSGQLLECSLAKPQAEPKSAVSNTQKPGPGLLPSYPPHVGYGLVGGAYGALGAGYPAPGLAQVTFFAFVFPLDIFGLFPDLTLLYYGLYFVLTEIIILMLNNGIIELLTSTESKSLLHCI